MIFVAVGNGSQGFLRLLNAVEMLAGNGLLASDQVCIQGGNNPSFVPKFCKKYDFLSMDQFAKFIRDADLIIAHAGAGTLFHVLQARKVPVVMPRRRQYGELVDDHQVELLQALALEGRVVPAYEPEDLPAAITEARRRSKQPMQPPPSRMLELVGQAITELIGKR
ncbi:MAG: glycosyltransferase [Nitrospirae bacterium]|nr:glycosyltransferase [Nitrospirota bacterium]